MIVLITHTKKDRRDYSRFRYLLNEQGDALECFPGTWLLSTNKDARSVFEILRLQLDVKDHIFVVEANMQ